MPQVHHSDVIGSLLRPRYLTRARDAFAAGQLTIAEFKRIEDRAVDAAIAMQESTGLDVVTDGEFRRFAFFDQVVGAIPGVTFGVHVCKGNNMSQWIGAGGYETTAEAMFGRLTNFDVFLLEYDDERSGSFEPLAKAPDDKQIILGLVSSKTTTLEPVSEVAARIHEAARYTGLERLGVSTQCGFSSTLPGANLTTEDVQEQKLALVAEVANTVW